MRCPECGGETMEIRFGDTGAGNYYLMEAEAFVYGVEYEKKFLDKPLFHCRKCMRNYCENLVNFYNVGDEFLS